MPFDLSTEHWLSDLDLLHDVLRQRHRNVYHTHSEAHLEGVVRALRHRMRDLASHEVIVEFARLIAAVGDGHTALHLTDIASFGRYPVEYYWFAEGIVVRRVRERYRELLGARIVAVNGRAIPEVVGALRPIISRDNEMGLIATVPTLLTIPEVCQARRVVADSLDMTLRLELPDGGQETVTLEPHAMRDDPWVELSPVALPLSRPSMTTNWFEVRPSGSVYLAYTTVRDHPDLTIAQLAERIGQAVRQPGVHRLIIDLRRNYGGNNLPNRALVHELIRADTLQQPGTLYALIGRRTFSAAMNFAVDLERHTSVVFVGEATGSSPNHYGENDELYLPESGLRLSVSSLWWQYSDPTDDRAWITPTIPVVETAHDYARGVDAALLAAENA